jgi:nucleoid-associated protein YgaU
MKIRTHLRAAIRYYTVQPGDTLIQISRKMYGTASRWLDICNANRPPIRDCNLIQPGWVLRIPD